MKFSSGLSILVMVGYYACEPPVVFGEPVILTFSNADLPVNISQLDSIT